MLRLVLLFALVPGAPAVAQNLPEWAEPLDPAPSPEQVPCPGADPGCLGDPEPAPIDGGLALLALAGAGYAVRRLRR